MREEFQRGASLKGEGLHNLRGGIREPSNRGGGLYDMISSQPQTKETPQAP